MTSLLTTEPVTAGGVDPLSRMAVTIPSCEHPEIAVNPSETTDRSHPGPLGRRRSASTIRRAYERGMATAEYAVGILAAVALALVLLRIITDNSFFSRLLRIVLQILERVGAMIGS